MNDGFVIELYGSFIYGSVDTLWIHLKISFGKSTTAAEKIINNIVWCSGFLQGKVFSSVLEEQSGDSSS